MTELETVYPELLRRYENIASGRGALRENKTGSRNIAIGFGALLKNTTGSGNIAIGFNALNGPAGGLSNIAIGNGALADLTAGFANIAVGGSVKTGSENVLIRGSVLDTGNRNIVIRGQVNKGNDNICIGCPGSTAEESDTIRIGTRNFQKRAFIAGISGTVTGVGDAVPVLIDSEGQLGTASSSVRYKEEIRDMGEVSSSLMRLRPVTFRYKKEYSNGARPLEYGLIAEEVAEVYPDLVVYSSTGQVETVQYHKLNVMLLNEVQRQQRQIQEQKRHIDELSQRIEALERVVKATQTAWREPTK